MTALPLKDQLVGETELSPVTPSGFRAAMGQVYDYLAANKVQWGAPDSGSVGVFIDGLKNPSVAVMKQNYLVVGGEDSSGWGISRYSRDVDGWSFITRIPMTDLVGAVIAPLESYWNDDVVILDATGRLRTVRRSGGVWNLVGNISDVVASLGADFSIARLSTWEVVVCDNGNMRVCKFDGSNWTVSASIAIAAGSRAVTVLDSQLIAVAGGGLIAAYVFDGVDTITLGASTAVAGLVDVAMSALNSSDVVMVDRDMNTIKVFRYDGEWQENGGEFDLSGLDMGVTGSSVALLGGSDIAVISGAEQKLRTYRLGFSVGKSLWPEHFRV